MGLMKIWKIKGGTLMVKECYVPHTEDTAGVRKEPLCMLPTQPAPSPLPGSQEVCPDSREQKTDCGKCLLSGKHAY